VAFAKARSDVGPRDKVVLVAGAFLKLNRRWNRVV
jgi:conjugal transfer pilus assembly protein TraW